MSEEAFLKGFAEVVAADELAMDTPLASLDGWDSVAYLGAMVFIEENMGVTLTPDMLVNVKTPGEIFSGARALQSS